MDNKKNVLLACTGSVASMKVPELCGQLVSSGFSVTIIATENALHFFDRETIQKGIKLYTDKDEWTSWSKRGDPVLHIELGKWADVFLIAPMDANTLAKFAMGLCDNLVACTARAWQLKKPLFFCPAMNTRMYQHPLTAQHITSLKTWGYHEIPAVEKTLICGDTGLGAMAHVETIVQTVVQHFQG